MARLINRIVHLLAGTQGHWPTLDALHATLHTRLIVCARLETAFIVLRDDIDECLNKLVEFSASTSESARAYYLSRAAEHAAPEGCGLLFVAAAAAHCDGTCATQDAYQMQLASLPCATQPCLEPDLELRLARVRCMAVQIMSSRHAAGSGVLGCDCRTALAASLAKPREWPAALLSVSPSMPICLATQDARRSQRRYVVAQVCADSRTCLTANQLRSASGRAGVQLSTGQVREGGRAAWLGCLRPGRKRFSVSCARRSTVALATLIAAADTWVQSGDAEWCPLSTVDFEELGSEDSAFKANSMYVGYEDGLPHAALRRIGYQMPESDNLLLYAVVEDDAAPDL